MPTLTDFRAAGFSTLPWSLVEPLIYLPAKLRTPLSSTRACTTTSPDERTTGALLASGSLAIDADAVWCDDAMEIADPIFHGVLPLLLAAAPLVPTVPSESAFLARPNTLS